ncbi:fumarylacetoacetate hydrolase family protein [Halobacillus naozhouensis]|uniref:Fumarylacetoacetate hydrolase family protein n=1 Tax=Halobacillus naozhouensis TaxID=554880 RepID=A0ABY8IZW9_9BACI|nr:fumarylacetoacetate hydrolase family protein [Halobacillus naozhouensis]WFT74276.1 fumarylacetoacetate hydrolase family protein [Halobacillus naozhouensis]
MKFVRFALKNDEVTKQGILSSEEIKEISGDIFNDWEYTGETFAGSQIELLAPIEPNQVIGIGANFVKDIKELPEQPPEMPVFFFKSLPSVTGPGSEIKIPDSIEEVKFESEIAVVMGKEANQIKEDDVLDHIFGYTVGNDVTAPQYFHEDGHWTLGKSFNTFTPLGPVIETDFDPTKARIEAIHNGAKKQDSKTDLMIVSIQRMIAYLSNVMILKPGDIILTGSPVGADFLAENDEIVCRVEGIGSLKNSVTKVKNSSLV